MDRNMIDDIRVLQDTFWYPKKVTLKIFLFGNFITYYQQTDVYFRVIRGKIVRSSVF